MNSDVPAPVVAPDANKYSRGRLVVAAGSARYPGAAVLAARAGQRMGAGYTQVFCAPEAVDVVRVSSPSLVVSAFSDLEEASLPAVRDGRPGAVCVGPGFVAGDPETDGLVLRLLKRARCPVLVDGGALACLRSKKALKRLSKRAERGLPTVITPHGGEAARLAASFGLSQAAPAQLAAGLALALHCIVTLKGPDTFLSDGKRVEVMREGTPALAKAGTGDVLAGMTAALLAQGADPFEAAASAATLHARAGKAAADALAEACVVAEDLLDFLPAVLGR